MGIIPRTPSPPPLEERDVITMNDDDYREMQKMIRDLKVCQSLVHAQLS